MTPTAPKSFLNQLKLIHDGIKVVWNQVIQRFEIWFVDKRNGITRVMLTAEDDDGNPMPLDNRILAILATRVDWEMMDKYPDPNEMYRVYREKKEIRSRGKWAKIREQREDWIDRNKKRIKEAHENALRGIWRLPKQKPEPKIYIYKR